MLTSIIFVYDKNANGKIKYINISDKYSSNTEIVDFYIYNKLGLHTEVRRLDYLIMNMIGWQTQSFNKDRNSNLIGQAIEILSTKRDLVKYNNYVQ